MTAKGGKKIESNLQTLCDSCNLGKSDLNLYK
jgi:5-methylcytosine-specific restriction endonuclease McrA